MLTYLRRLVDERTSLTDIATRMADSAAAEDRELNEAERAEMTRMETRCAELDSQITQHNGQLESARAYATLVERIEANGGGGHVPEQRQPSRGIIESTSPGQAFVESEQFRTYAGHGQSGRVSIADYLETRAVIKTTDLAIPAQVIAPIEPQYRPTLVNVVNVMRVSSGVVNWVVVGPDPTAAVVAEGAAKPEAAATFTPATAALDTLAHWYQITRQALEDAAYVRSLLEGKLRRGLTKKVDADLAALIVAITSPSVTAAGDLNKAIRMAVGTVEGNGYSPNAVLLNPADYATLDLAAAAAPGGTPATRTTSFWGLTPIPSSAVTAGMAFVGDFNAGVTLFDRGATDVFVTDSHASLFISNVLVILAETRVKSVIDEPNALCQAKTA